MFLLKSGQVELYRQSPDGQRLTLAIIEERTFFGEMSLVDVHMEGTFAEAHEDSVICILSRHDVEDLILKHPVVAIRIIEVVTERLERTRSFLQEMAFNDLTERVANLLLRLADESTNIIDGFSHDDLAPMVGCRRESFSVIVDRFRRARAVATGRKRIEIIDRSYLEEVVHERYADHSAIRIAGNSKLVGKS